MHFAISAFTVATLLVAATAAPIPEPEPLLHHVEEGLKEGLHIGKQYDLPGQGGAPPASGGGDFSAPAGSDISSTGGDPNMLPNGSLQE